MESETQSSALPLDAPTLPFILANMLVTLYLPIWFQILQIYYMNEFDQISVVDCTQKTIYFKAVQAKYFVWF